MKIKIALFMIASAAAIGAGIARAEDVSSKNTHVGIRAPGETGQQTRVLHSLALALSDGNEAMDFLHGPPSDVELDKDRLNLSIDSMDCYIDRNANYISCYSAPIGLKEAETLFAQVIDELQSALPSDNWKGSKEEAGSPSVRSYVYNDLESNAHINISVITWVGPTEETSYKVSIFGWPS
jgi:hypothetical protein